MHLVKHIFFDLDRTLWDFEKNAFETLAELFQLHALQSRGVSRLEDFINCYKKHNESLWALNREGKVTKEILRSKRFCLALDEFGIQDDYLAKKLGDQYIQQCPLKINMFPFTHEVLSYLQEKYHLHIITNGFEEVQHVKLEQSKLSPYFQQIITSEQVGVKKPDPAIFQYALQKASSNANQSIMIGDDLPVDILGAKAIGMKQVYFNPHQEAHQEELTHEITCLSELMTLL